MTPAQVGAIAESKGKVDSTVAANSGFLSIFTSAKLPPKAELEEGLMAVKEQLAGLDRWRSSAPDNPDPAKVPKGNTEYSHEWGGQLVTVTCHDGELVCTVGELNALPDFFGSFDDLGRVDRSVVFKTLQVIRREAYMYLKTIEAGLTGASYEYDAKGESFSGLEGNSISVDGVGPKAANDLADFKATETMLAGGDGELGLDESIGAAATLGRNACHFPPESWLRWREHHTKARALIDAATTLDQLGPAANTAIGLNAFGEHYLQDSYAAGHLINKGFVMAVAMEHMREATKQTWGITDKIVLELQEATAHHDAYDLPDAAMQKRDALADGGAEPKNTMDDATITAPRPADRPRVGQGRRAGRRLQGGGEGRGGARQRGHPEVMTFEQYRTWLNDLWLQKITNTLHDRYCVRGLSVASPDNPDIFRIYGDSNMIKSAEGAAYTAVTSQMSPRRDQRPRPEQTTTLGGSFVLDVGVDRVTQHSESTRCARAFGGA